MELKKIEELYCNCFESYEREPFEKIVERVEKGTSFILSNEYGAVIYDWYPKSKVLLLIYIFVDPNCRRKGIGKELYNKGLELKEQLHAETILFEVEKEGTDKFSEQRISFYNKMGAERIDLDYVQPPLDVDLPYLHLYLYKYKNMSNGNLQVFLREFYKQLGYEYDKELTRMINYLNKL